MNLTHVHLGGVTRALGCSSFGDVLVQLAKGELAAEDIDVLVNEAIAGGRIRTKQVIASVKHRPLESPWRVAQREAIRSDMLTTAECKDFREVGIVGQFERRLHAICDDLAAMSVPWREAEWAALNDLALDLGDVGRVARAVRWSRVRLIREEIRKRDDF